MQLPAATPLGDLRALVLGDHPLELAQQLVLRGARSLGLLGEHDLDPAARELLQQQHLVGVAAREPVRRMTQHDLEAPVERPVAKPLQRRAAASSRRRTRRPRRRTPPGRPARAARPAHAARRSGSGSSALGAGAPRTPARRSPRPSTGRWSACRCRSSPLPSLPITHRRSGANTEYACASRAPASRSPTNSISTRLATAPLASTGEIGTHRLGSHRAQRLTGHARPCRRSPSINDGANLTVNTAVRSGTGTPSGPLQPRVDVPPRLPLRQTELRLQRPHRVRRRPASAHRTAARFTRTAYSSA